MGERPKRGRVRWGRLAGGAFAVGIIGIAIAVIRSRDLEGEMAGAVRHGDVAQVRALLEKDPKLAMAKVYPQGSNTDPSRRKWAGRYVIHDAISLGNDATEILELLVANGADPKVRFQGRTLLHQAAFDGNLVGMRWLLDHGADPNSRIDCDPCPGQGRTPLHDAQRFRDDEASALLLERGAAVDATDARGRSALHASAEEGSPVGALVLCSHGADPNRRDTDGRTPFDVARDVDQRGRKTAHTEILGPGEQADWLRPEGGCARLVALAAGGAVVDEATAHAVFREYACARGHTNSCAPVS